MSKIISIGTAVPVHRTRQDTILRFMHAAYNNDVASRKLNALFHGSGIETRYSVIPDFDKSRGEHIFFNGTPSTANVMDRLDVFKERAVPLAEKAIRAACEKLETTLAWLDVTHLITVTCTGLSAPGLDAELISRLGLRNDIYRTSVNFLGCNAAFHALKIADMICRTDAGARVLIVCVELCTLHFQPKNNHDNLLSNTIFGDGAAAVIVKPDAATEKGLSMRGFYSTLLDKGKDLMGWDITPVNFEMVLDARIPEFIGEEVDAIVKNALVRYQTKLSDIHRWAIHPGGKKIIDTIRRQLQLSDPDVQPAYRVLQEYGNMSSPTILFVLDDLAQNGYNSGETVFSIGFGPGLSIETALLCYE